MKDMFGNSLYIDDFVIYAELLVSGKAVLHMYEIVGKQDDLFIGELKSGEYMGCRYLLVDTDTRCVLLRNVYKDVDCDRTVTIH